MGLGLDGASVVVEQFCVGDGAVVVDLSPSAVDSVKDAASADVEIDGSPGFGELASLTAGEDGRCVAEVIGHDVPEFDPDVCGPIEDTVVETADGSDAVEDPAKWVIEADEFVRHPDLAEDVEVAVIESEIERFEGGEGAVHSGLGGVFEPTSGGPAEGLVDVGIAQRFMPCRFVLG